MTEDVEQRLRTRIAELESAIMQDGGHPIIELQARCDRYLQALVDIIRAEEEAPVGMSSPVRIARAAIEEDA